MDKDTQPIMDKNLEKVNEMKVSFEEWGKVLKDAVEFASKHMYKYWYDAIQYRWYVIALLERTGGETTFSKDEFIQTDEKYFGKFIRIAHIDNGDGTVTIRTEIVEEKEEDKEN